MNDTQNGPLSHALKLEREYLFQLGSILGQCAEKLICLALQDARRMSARTTPTAETAHQWAYFIGALTPALDHTEIESKVRLLVASSSVVSVNTSYSDLC